MEYLKFLRSSAVAEKQTHYMYIASPTLYPSPPCHDATKIGSQKRYYFGFYCVLNVIVLYGLSYYCIESVCVSSAAGPARQHPRILPMPLRQSHEVLPSVSIRYRDSASPHQKAIPVQPSLWPKVYARRGTWIFLVYFSS